MKSRIALVGALACAVIAGAAEPTPPMGLSTGQPSRPPPRAGEVTIALSAATLADDCGQGEPMPPVKSEKKSEQAGAGRADMSGARMKRRCEQSSMQLSVQMENTGAPVELRVKKVELFDETGKLLGELTARSPSVWSSTGEYQAWDQKVAPGSQLQVTYPLSSPNWGAIGNRRNQTYLLKATLSVGGSDRAVQRNVAVEAEAILPPNVRT